MVTPLQYGDPPHLGPFVLHARLRVSAAGLVYLGQDAQGRAVSVAVLNRGAEVDAAARDRFVRAIREAEHRQGPPADSPHTRGPEVPPVVGMHDGRAPWVAVLYVPGGPGAEVFLDPVAVTGMLVGARTGPDFAPHWLGDRFPALPPPPPPPGPPIATSRQVVLSSALLTALSLVAVVVLWLLLARGGDDPPPPQPIPATRFVPTPPPQPTPSPSGASPSPSPSASPMESDERGGAI